MIKVAVIMSTYNGELYVKEQIESILKQAEVDITLFVRDDGSRDKTIDIIERLEKCNNKIHFMKGTNIGVGNSFMHMLYDVPDDYDYYAFSDQDDVWNQKKMYKAVEMLNNTNKQLYVSNQKCVDENGKYIMMRYDSAPNLDPIDVLSKNRGTGCTMVFSRKFKNLLCNHNHRPSEELLKVRIHDAWVTMVGAVTQTIIYDNNAYICYRQHGNNVVGAFEPSFKDKLKEKLKKYKNRELRNGRSIMAKEITEHFYDYAKKFPLLFICATYKKSIRNRLRLIGNYSEFKKYNSFITFTIYVVFGLF